MSLETADPHLILHVAALRRRVAVCVHDEILGADRPDRGIGEVRHESTECVRLEERGRVREHEDLALGFGYGESLSMFLAQALRRSHQTDPPGRVLLDNAIRGVI